MGFHRSPVPASPSKHKEIDMDFNKEELKLLDMGLCLVRADSINEIDWAQRDTNAPEGYAQEMRKKIERINDLLTRIRSLEN